MVTSRINMLASKTSLLIKCLLLLSLLVLVRRLVLDLLFSTLCPSSFAIIFMGKTELVSLLKLSS